MNASKQRGLLAILALRGALITLLAALCCVSLAHAETVKYKVSGLETPVRKNLRAHIGRIDSETAASDARLALVLNAALKAALPPFGYYAAQHRVERSGAVLLIEVDPGARVLFVPASITVGDAARTLPAIVAMLDKAPFAPGTGLSHQLYDDFRDDLLLLCQRLGFFDARYVESTLLIDPAQLSAEVRLELDPGERYVFEQSDISGSSVDPALLESLAPFRAGDPFSAELVTRFERRLRDTGYFRELALSVERKADARAQVVVLAEDLSTTRYDVGAGFSTDSSLRLRFNRHTPLMNPAGHSLSIESELSEPRQSVASVYRIPHSDPLADIFEISAGMQGKRVEDTDSKTATVGIRHALTLPGDWLYNYGLSAELERYTVGSETEKDAAYLLPSTSIARTRLDPGPDPLNGTSFWTAVDFSDPMVGAPAQFLRWRGNAKWLFGLPNDNTTVLARVEFGAIWTDGFNQIPASLRFNAGGDRSIRGYDFESLGPRDVEGKLIGGRYLSVGSLEVSHRVRPQWRVAAFVDGGGAFTEQSDDFYQSAGLGVRWLSPIGQIRVDLAVPVQDGEHSGFKLHISMGPPL